MPCRSQVATHVSIARRAVHAPMPGWLPAVMQGARCLSVFPTNAWGRSARHEQPAVERAGALGSLQLRAARAAAMMRVTRPARGAPGRTHTSSLGAACLCGGVSEGWPSSAWQAAQHLSVQMGSCYIAGVDTQQGWMRGRCIGWRVPTSVHRPRRCSAIAHIRVIAAAAVTARSASQSRSAARWRLRLPASTTTPP